MCSGHPVEHLCVESLLLITDASIPTTIVCRSQETKNHRTGTKVAPLHGGQCLTLLRHSVVEGRVLPSVSDAMLCLLLNALCVEPIRGADGEHKGRLAGGKPARGEHICQGFIKRSVCQQLCAGGPGLIPEKFMGRETTVGVIEQCKSQIGGVGE